MAGQREPVHYEMQQICVGSKQTLRLPGVQEYRPLIITAACDSSGPRPHVMIRAMQVGEGDT
jgi:hypothetical protein